MYHSTKIASSRFKGVKGFNGRFEKGTLKPIPDWYKEKLGIKLLGSMSCAVDLYPPHRASRPLVLPVLVLLTPFLT
jgi:hypothetical protein